MATLEAYKGNGYAKSLVKTIFENMSEYNGKFMLYQTAIPKFYTHMGAKVIENRCVTGVDDDTRPWKDDYVIVYPESVDLKDWVVNICGEGY